MPIETRIDDLSSPEVQALVAEHLAGMRSQTPPDHVNALALDALRQPDVTFWTAWCGDDLCGCGALKALDRSSGEIKSMRTRAAFLRQGVGQAVLDRILRTARRRGYERVVLETGTGPAFAAAHSLYLRNGFTGCGPFGSYEATDFNVFMQCDLQASRRNVQLPRDAGPVRLRRLRADDLPRFHAYRSDPAAAQFQGWSPMSQAQALAFIEDMAAAELLMPGTWSQLAIADTAGDELVGDVGLHLSPQGDTGEVGFTLAPAARGRGHATAAVVQAVDLLFEHTGASRVLGVTDARNTPSVHVLERAGFRRIETRETVFKGEPCIEWVYAVRR